MVAGTPEAGAPRYRDALQRAGWNQVGEMAPAEGGGLTFAAVRGEVPASACVN